MNEEGDFANSRPISFFVDYSIVIKSQRASKLKSCKVKGFKVWLNQYSLELLFEEVKESTLNYFKRGCLEANIST